MEQLLWSNYCSSWTPAPDQYINTTGCPKKWKMLLEPKNPIQVLGAVGPNFPLDMTWERIFLLSLSGENNFQRWARPSPVDSWEGRRLLVTERVNCVPAAFWKLLFWTPCTSLGAFRVGEPSSCPHPLTLDAQLVSFDILLWANLLLLTLACVYVNISCHVLNCPNLSLWVQYQYDAQVPISCRAGHSF